MLRRPRFVVALLLAVACVACNTPSSTPTVTIACLGDSITNGLTHGSAGNQPPQHDAAGGFPGRLAQLLPGTRVLNRGIGGMTAGGWVASPSSDLGRAVWNLTAVAGWPDYVPHDPAPDAPSAAVALLAPEKPDVVVVLLGFNDLMVASQRHDPDPVARLLADLTTLVTQLRHVAPTVLVSTILPNHTLSAETMTAVNDGIRTAHPDFLPLGERFAAAGWESLLGDHVHPNEAGYAVLASALADELQRRGLAGRAR